MTATVHPFKSPKPPSEAALAVARALAILHARIHHAAEVARQPNPTRATEQAR